MRRGLAAVVGLLALTLGGCAVQQVSPDRDALADRRVAETFELEGRLSATDADRGASGRLSWSHAPERDEWTVYSPLGQVIAQLVGTPDRAVLRSADGRTVEAESAQTMLPDLLGVDAPLGGLPHWVQGAIRPGARVLLVDGAGRPARVSDEGWLIDYAEYAGDEPDAPVRRIEASRGEARVRLIIDEWIALP